MKKNLSLSTLVFPLVFKWVLSKSRTFWVSVSCVSLLLLFSTRIFEHSMVTTHRPSNVLNTCQHVLKGCGWENAITSWVIGTRKRTLCTEIRQRINSKAVMGSFVTHGTAYHHMPRVPHEISENQGVKIGPRNWSIHSTHFRVPQGVLL